MSEITLVEFFLSKAAWEARGCNVRPFSFLQLYYIIRRHAEWIWATIVRDRYS